MKKLSQILLLSISRQIVSLPAGESILDSLTQNPTIKHKLGRSSTLSLKLDSGSVLATTAEQVWQFKKGMLLRLTYDDGSISEWRIVSTDRDHSGGKDFQIEAEHIAQDLKRTTVRQHLVTGATRISVGFYKMDVATIAGRLLSSEFNGPELFSLGNVAVGITGEFNLVLNAATHIQALSELCKAAEAEWDIEYQPGSDSYLVHFYETGALGGGEAQASKRPIGMGSELGNRLEIERRDETRDDFSRVVPISGQGAEIQSLSGVTWAVASSALSGPNRAVSLRDNIIFKNGYGTVAGHGVYFAGRLVVSTQAPNIVVVQGTSGVSGSGKFTIDGTTKELSFIEDPSAVAEIGVAEIPYNRPDISPYANLIRNAAITADLSEWSGGMPVGFQKIEGSELVEQEVSSLFVRYGASSAKVTAGKDQGLSTIEIPINPSDEDPYFSSVVYLQVVSGSVRVELEMESGKILPDNIKAETNVRETRAIQIAGVDLKGSFCKIRLIAQEEGTIFFIDAMTLTQSAFAIEYNQLMGPADLYWEASKYLYRNSGRSPDLWRGKAYDAAYFYPGDLEEITTGSWVTVKEDFDGANYATERVLRVVELQYRESPEYGRQEKTVVLAEKTSSLSRPFTDTFLTISSQQSQLGMRSVVTPSTFTPEDFEEIQFFWITKTREEVGGSIIQLPIDPVSASLFFEGLRITVVNPVSFEKHDFVISRDQKPGDIFLDIEQAALTNPIPAGSYVFISGFSSSRGIIEGRNFIRIYAMMLGVGEVMTAVDGLVSELDINVFGYLSAGDIVHPADPDRKEPYSIELGGAEGAEYDSGRQMVPIKEQQLKIPAGTYIQISGVSLSSRFHVDPGQIKILVERNARGNAIGVLISDLAAGSIITNLVMRCTEAINLIDGQEFILSNKKGESQFVTVNGAQITTAGPPWPAGGANTIIEINSIELAHDHEAGISTLYEPSHTQTGRITVQGGRIELIAGHTNLAGGAAFASINMKGRIDTNENGVATNATAIINIQTHVNLAGGAAFAAINMESRISTNEDGVANNIQSISTIDAAVVKLDADDRMIFRQTAAPTIRPSGKPLKLGDVWLDSTIGDNGLPKNELYVLTNLTGPVWTRSEEDIRVAQAGLVAQSSIIEGQYFARTVMYADAGNGVLGTFTIDANGDTQESTASLIANNVIIKGDNVDINSIRIDKLGAMYTTGTYAFDGGVVNGVIQGYGTTGWAIDRTGYAVFNNVDVRNGTIDISTLVNLTVTGVLTMGTSGVITTSGDHYLINSSGIAIRRNSGANTIPERTFGIIDSGGTLTAGLWSASNGTTWLSSITGNISMDLWSGGTFQSPSGFLGKFQITSAGQININATGSMEFSTGINGRISLDQARLRLFNVTTAGMNGMTSPLHGDMLFNLTLQRPVVYTSSGWRQVQTSAI